MPIIALGDGFSHIVGRGVFVFLADLCALEFFGFGREDDVEGVFGPVSHHHGDFSAIKIGVGENEFVGTGSEVEVEIPIEAGLSEFRPISVKNLYHWQRRMGGIHDQSSDLGLEVGQQPH